MYVTELAMLPKKGPFLAQLVMGKNTKKRKGKKDVPTVETAKYHPKTGVAKEYGSITPTAMVLDMSQSSIMLRAVHVGQPVKRARKLIRKHAEHVMVKAVLRTNVRNVMVKAVMPAPPVKDMPTFSILVPAAMDLV